ncbi:MAG TPA: hypothetical protein VFW33_13280, partial [Gemmataceae bacterium]|nr:hypothetical protein [Gemmataceae bacterium]
MTDTLYPALFSRLDAALPEYGWQKHGDAWVATSWPSDFPFSVQHKHPDRLMVYADSPWWVKVHGHSGVRFLDLMNGGRMPRGAEFLDALRKLCGLAGVDCPLKTDDPTSVEDAHRQEERIAILEDYVGFCSDR